MGGCWSLHREHRARLGAELSEVGAEFASRVPWEERGTGEGRHPPPPPQTGAERSEEGSSYAPLPPPSFGA